MHLDKGPGLEGYLAHKKTPTPLGSGGGCTCMVPLFMAKTDPAMHPPTMRLYLLEAFQVW